MLNEEKAKLWIVKSKLSLYHTHIVNLKSSFYHIPCSSTCTKTLELRNYHVYHVYVWHKIIIIFNCNFVALSVSAVDQRLVIKWSRLTFWLFPIDLCETTPHHYLLQPCFLKIRKPFITLHEIEVGGVITHTKKHQSWKRPPFYKMFLRKV